MIDVVNWYLPDSFYPAAPALLQGESPFFYPYNHLSPYQQLGYMRISNVVQGGEASVEFEMDLRGYVQGVVLGLDWDDASRTMSWARIEVKSGSTGYNWYVWDGWFDGYLDPGNYQAKVTEWTSQSEGHRMYEFVLNVSEGQSGSVTIMLDQSGIAIPEFTSALPVVFMTFTLALTGLRSRQKRLRNNREN
jgi:hypothetical protein